MKSTIPLLATALLYLYGPSFPSVYAQCTTEAVLTFTGINHDGTCDNSDPGGPDPALELYVAGNLVFNSQWNDLSFGSMPELNIPLPAGPGPCGNGASANLGEVGPSQMSILLGVVIFESDGPDCVPYDPLVDQDQGAGTVNLLLTPGVGTFDVGSCMSINYQLDLVPGGSVSGVFTGPICPNEGIDINGTIYDINNPTGSEVLTGAAFEGCDSIVEVDLQFFPAPMPVISGPTAFCEANTIVLNAGTGYTTYAWSTGPNAQSIFATSPGTFEVTVTDANGCMGTDSQVVVQGTIPMPAISGPSTICPDEAAILDAGPGYNSYIWSNSVFTQLNTVNGAGTYFLTVTNTDGCSGTDTYEVSLLPEATPVITGPTTLCLGELITLDAGPGFVSYSWSDGSSNQSLDVTEPGLYTVTVLNAEGCSGMASVEVLLSDGPDFSLSGPAQICLHGMDTLSATGGFASYLWSNGSMDAVTLITSPGVYYLTVTDAGGCMGIDSISVDTLQGPEPLITGIDQFCEGESSILSVEGGPFDSIHWSTGSILPFTLVTDSDTVIVEVFDANGCLGLDTFVVEELSEDVRVVNLSSCNPLDTGVVINTYTNQYGCDSVEVTITELETGIDTLLFDFTSCNLNDTGVFVDMYLNASGCEVVEITTVTFSLADTTIIQQTSCDIDDVGISVDLYTNQFGCDSLVRTIIQFADADTSFVQNYSCSPQDTGLVISTFQNQFGCDSVEFLRTDLLTPPDTTYAEFGTCNPFYVGQVVQDLQNQWGCDSVVVLDVYQLPLDTIYNQSFTCNPQDTGLIVQELENQFGCDSLVFSEVSLLPGRDTLYTTEFTCNSQDTGLFEVVYANQFGCDSTVITSVELQPSDTTYIQQSSCNPQDTGLVINTFVNQFGCDSLEFVQTDLLPGNDSIITFSSSCNPQDTGTVVTILTNSFGCDSLLIDVVTLNPTDSIYIELESCEPQDTGWVVNTYVNQFGCDSLEFIYTQLLPTSDTTFLYDETCSPAQAGLFTINLVNEFGCDSIILIDVALNPTDFQFFTAVSCNPIDTGSTIEIFTNQFGCDSVILTFTGLLPGSDTTFLDLPTCDPNGGGVFVDSYSNIFGCDSVVVQTLTYAPPDSVYLQAASCNPLDTGLQVSLFTNTIGCDSLTFTQVSLLPDSDTTFLSATTCDPDEAGIFMSVLPNSFGCDSTIVETIELLPSQINYQTSYSCNPLDTGTVVNSFINQFGCDSVVVVEVLLDVPAICQVQAEVAVEDINCFGAGDGACSFFISQGATPVSYTLTSGAGVVTSGVINSLNQSINLLNLPAGNYQLLLETATEATASYDFTIHEPFELQTSIAINSDFNGYAVSCADAFDGALSVTTTGGTTPYSYSWSNGSTNSNLIGLPIGAYDLVVEDANGCVAVAAVVLEAPPAMEMDVLVNAVNCFEENTGSIEVRNTTGGLPPYLYQLNNGNFSDQVLFDSLPEGLHELVVQDALGCEQNLVLTLEGASDLLIDAGRDTTIELGQQIELDPLTNQYQIVSVQWSPADYLSCTDCYNPLAAPPQSTLYTVLMEDVRGCMGLDSVLVRVIDTKQFSIPNIFSPNEDGYNDVLEVSVSQNVDRIDAFRIFDRWGELVYQINNVSRMTDVTGWDGTFQGEPATVGVYVFMMEYTLKDGEQKMRTGTITLVR